MKYKVRNSSIEVLRILAMLFIVTSHYSVHGVGNTNVLGLGFNKFFLDFAVLGNLGVVIYFLISGYFLIGQKFNLKKIVKLYLQIMFYSVGIYLIFIIFDIVKFNIHDLIYSIFPLTFDSYWFMTVYFIILIISPFLNILINKLSKKEHLNLIIIMLILWSIIPTFTHQLLYSNGLINAIMLYFIGSYIKLYGFKIFTRNKNVYIALGTIISLYLLSSITLNILGIWKEFFSLHATFFYTKESLLVIGLGVVMFYIAIKHQFTNRFINTISSCTLGVYLIHDNFLMRNVIWTKIFKVSKYMNTPYMILNYIIAVISIFCVCTIIDYIRKKVIEINIEGVLNKICEVINFFSQKIRLIFEEIF